MSARLLEISEADYFADKILPDTPTLSQSIASVLIDKSPLHAWAAHPRLGNCDGSETTKALDDGTLMHHMLLGTGAGAVTIIDAKDYRTKDAQALRDAAIAAGSLPVLAHKYDELFSGVKTIRQRMADAGVDLALFDAAKSESAILWQEDGVWCRGKMDKLHVERRTIFDVKKTRSAKPSDCGKAMMNYGYDIQWAAYTSALDELTGSPGDADMQIIFIEDVAPYVVTVGRPDGIMRELGAKKWRQAVAMWKSCMESGRWPGYAASPVRFEAPPWSIAQQMASEMEDESDE